jgi:hypothetical protein
MYQHDSNYTVLSCINMTLQLHSVKAIPEVRDIYTLYDETAPYGSLSQTPRLSCCST